MKKFHSIIPAALIAISLTACNDVRENGKADVSDPIVNSDTDPLHLPDGVISESSIEDVKNTYNSEFEQVYDTKIIDLDLDGENELLVLVGRANTKEFDVWKNSGGEMIRQSSFGTGKVNFIDKISLKKAEINGEKVHLFSFSYASGGAMEADEVLSVIRKKSDSYEAEYLLSRGTITYSDIAEPFTKQFFRKGWSKYDIGMDTDHGDITEEEYNRLYDEYTSGLSV